MAQLDQKPLASNKFAQKLTDKIISNNIMKVRIKLFGRLL